MFTLLRFLLILEKTLCIRRAQRLGLYTSLYLHSLQEILTGLHSGLDGTKEIGKDWSGRKMVKHSLVLPSMHMFTVTLIELQLLVHV